MCLAVLESDLDLLVRFEVRVLAAVLVGEEEEVGSIAAGSRYGAANEA